VEWKDAQTAGPRFLSFPARCFPVGVLILQLLLALAGGMSLRLAPAYGLEELLPERTRRDLNFLREEFPSPDDLLLFVRGGSAERWEQFLEDLDKQLSLTPELFPDRLYKLDLTFLRNRLLFFLSRQHLRQLYGVVQQLAPKLKSGISLSDWTPGVQKAPPQGLEAFYQEQLKTSLKSRGRAAWRNPLDFLLQPEQAELLRPFWLGQTVRYLQLNGETHLLLVRPAQDLAVSVLRRRLQEVAQRNPEMDVELTGNPAIVSEQRRAVIRELGSAGAVLGLSLFLAALAGLLPWRRFLLACLPGVLGVTASAGLGSLFLGLGAVWLTAQSIVVILTGYSILHYAVDRDLGHLTRLSLSAFLGFACLACLPSNPFAGLGACCCLGILISSWCLLTAIPALDQLGLIPQDSGVSTWVQRRWPGRRPTRGILAVTAVGALLCLSCVDKASFSANPLHALDVNAPSLRAERELQQRGTSSLFALVLAPNLRQARAYTEVVRSFPRVEQTFSLVQFLPPQPNQEQRKLVGKIAALASQAQVPKGIPLDSAADLLRLQQMSSTRNGPTLADEVLLRELGPGGIQDALKSFQKNLLLDLGRLLDLLRQQRAEPFNPEELPRGVRERLVGTSGAVAVLVFPKLTEGDDSLENFVADLRKAVPRVGGPAVMAADLSELTRQALRLVPWALGLGALVGLWVATGSLWRSLLIIAGPSLALVFTRAGLALFQVSLNFLTWPAPAVVLLLGLSVSMSSLRRPRASLKALFPALAILVLAMFMLGSVHPGLAGLGLVMALGMVFNLLVAVVVLPSVETLARVWSVRRVGGGGT